MTDGSARDVALWLTKLAAHPGVEIASQHRLAPRGFTNLKEIELDKDGSPVPDAMRAPMRRWWLGHNRHVRTPVWDLAGEASVHGRPGVLLVEAKAHAAELEGESIGKRLVTGASANQRANHERIGVAIKEASIDLARVTGTRWGLSRDSHYQMSNRFAWAWKLAQQGIPVVLVYLGFLGAEEMIRHGALFADHEAWRRTVIAHSHGVVPTAIWSSNEVSVAGSPMIVLVRSCHVGLDGRLLGPER